MWTSVFRSVYININMRYWSAGKTSFITYKICFYPLKIFPGAILWKKINRSRPRSSWGRRWWHFGRSGQRGCRIISGRRSFWGHHPHWLNSKGQTEEDHLQSHSQCIYNERDRLLWLAAVQLRGDYFDSLLDRHLATR